MKALRAEYKRLSPLSRLAVWASITTILTLFVPLILYLLHDSGSGQPVAAPVITSRTDSKEPPVTPPVNSVTGISGLSGTIHGNINTVIQTGSGSVIIGTPPPEALGPRYPEPTPPEMREALLRQIRKRILGGNPGSAVLLQWLKLGLALDLVEFDKLACSAATPDPGYNCDYQYTLGGVIESEDNRPEVRKSVDDLNRLIGSWPGGIEHGIGRGRFIKSEDRWVVVTG